MVTPIGAPRICVLGSINMDLVVRTPRFPAPGETILGGPFRTFAGGKGANQAGAARRMGAAVQMIAAVGRDAHGSQLLRGLWEEGIDTGLIRESEESAIGTALITVDEAGENTIVVASGANAEVGPSDVEAARDEIAASDLLVAQLEVPVRALLAAARIAAAGGTPLMLNAAPARSLPIELLQQVEVLVVNRVEAAQLAGRDPATDPEELARGLGDLGAGHAVLTLGREGALLWDGARSISAPAREVEVVDTTGCGDAFVGALAACWGPREDRERALAIACAAGALAATVPGAQSSLPRREEVEALCGA